MKIKETFLIFLLYKNKSIWSKAEAKCLKECEEMASDSSYKFLNINIIEFPLITSGKHDDKSVYIN